MTEPTDAQVAALALPGEDWPQARRRAERLLAAVKQCVPCRYCDPEFLAHYRWSRGWVDETTAYADMCPRCYEFEHESPFDPLDDDYT